MLIFFIKNGVILSLNMNYFFSSAIVCELIYYTIISIFAGYGQTF